MAPAQEGDSVNMYVCVSWRKQVYDMRLCPSGPRRGPIKRVRGAQLQVPQTCHLQSLLVLISRLTYLLAS
jgi:hypothetical protein